MDMRPAPLRRGRPACATAAGMSPQPVAMGFDFLRFLPPAFLYIAFAAWTAAFAGLVFDLSRRVGTLRA